MGEVGRRGRQRSTLVGSRSAGAGERSIDGAGSWVTGVERISLSVALSRGMTSGVCHVTCINFYKN